MVGRYLVFGCLDAYLAVSLGSLGPGVGQDIAHPEGPSFGSTDPQNHTRHCLVVQVGFQSGTMTPTLWLHV